MTSPNPTAPWKKPPTILVVDDEPQNVSLMADVLQNAGYRTLVATSGPRAIEVLETQTPDAILLDLLMPGMDGFEVIRRVRQAAQFSHVPILVVTALQLTEEERQRLQSGAQHIFQKGTFWIGDMLKELERIVGPGAASG